MDIEGRILHSLTDAGVGRVEGWTLDRCEVFSGGLLSRRGPEHRTVVEDVMVDRCRFRGCSVGPAILRKVTLSRSSATDLSIFMGTLFDRVTIVGRVSGLKVNTFVSAVYPDAARQAEFDQHRLRFYETVPWALDISAAKLSTFEVAGIPVDLIRIDPATQAIVRREALLGVDWRAAIDDTNRWTPYLWDMLAAGHDGVVLAVPLARDRETRRRCEADLAKIRLAGLVAPA